MVGCRVILKEKQAWLATLLKCKFFDACAVHEDLRKNERNAFCIDCNVGFCRNCSATHENHNHIQICRYVYHNVVRMQDIQKYLDCSNIQTYKINGEKAVHLNSRPQTKDSKASAKSRAGSCCEACGRHIQDVPNGFCSIACKVEGSSDMANNQDQNLVTSQVQKTDVSLFSPALQLRKHLLKRKGYPCRSPLF